MHENSDIRAGTATLPAVVLFYKEAEHKLIPDDSLH